MASPALFATILTMDAAGPVGAALLVREVRIGAVGAAADLALLPAGGSADARRRPPIWPWRQPEGGGRPDG
jgi:hypothetical protein